MVHIGNTPASNFASVTKDTFSGDGSTTAFTLSKAATTNGVAVFVENVRQEPTTAYAVSGTTLTFTAAPVSASGNNIYVLHHNAPASTATHPAAQALTATSGTFTSNIDVDGTANLDAVDIDGAVDMASTLAVAGVSSLTNRLTVLAADGTSDNNYVMDVRNDEQTDDRSYGLRVSAGSTYTDRAFDVLDHAQANTLLRVLGNGIVSRPQTPAVFATRNSTEQVFSGQSAVITDLDSSYYNSYSTNNKSWWDASTSKYTAPTGSGTTYHYVSLSSLFGVTIPSSGTNYGLIGIYHSGTGTANTLYRAYMNVPNESGTAGNMLFDTLVACGVVKMVAGNYLQPFADGTNGVDKRVHSGTYTNFSAIQIA